LYPIKGFQWLGRGLKAGMNSAEPGGLVKETSGDDADPLTDRQNVSLDISLPPYLHLVSFIWPQD
jgi:hypothetical protein